MNFSDVAIFDVKENDYRIDFWYANKDDAMEVMENSDLNKKIDYYKFFFLSRHKKKISTYYRRNKERILKQAKQYYENNKERLKE